MPTDSEPTETPIDSFTIESDVVIPIYRPLDVPYSEWEAARSQELLTANGFGSTMAEWRRATGHPSGLLRGTAYYLLTQHPEQQDENLYRQGLDDLDETVQVISAYGLYLLGDSSALPALEKIAGYDVGAHTAAARAAGILGELGDPTAFATIQKAMQSEQRYVRLFAIENAMAFVPLHGQTYAPGKTIDIWSLYRQALQDENGQVRSVAKLQLRELNTPEALELLK
jgi:HEAT repeat protein